MADKTIKELGEEFYVSKQAIRKDYQLILEKTTCKPLLGTE